MINVVWEHKKAGSALLAVHTRVYDLLLEYMRPKVGADLVFHTASGENVTDMGIELEKLSEHFGQKFISPSGKRPTEQT